MSFGLLYPSFPDDTSKDVANNYEDKKDNNIYKHLICPRCQSKSCTVVLSKTDALLLDNGWGAYETLCECDDCGRDFRLSVSFEYKIKTSHTRLCDN